VADHEHRPSVGSGPFGIAGVDKGNPGQQRTGDLTGYRPQPVKRNREDGQFGGFRRLPVSHDRDARQVCQPRHDGGIFRRARSHRDAVTPVQQPARQRPADRSGPEHRYAHARDYVSARELFPYSAASPELLSDRGVPGRPRH
jgi:hypothetical protein